MMRAPLPTLTLTLLALLAVGCDRQENAASPPADLPADLPVLNVAGYERLVRETAAEGRVLVVDLWATWCAPCIEMFPRIHDEVQALGDQVRLVSITIDDTGQIPAAVRFLRSQHALNDAWKLEADQDAQLAFNAAVGRQWNSLVVPAILIYDRRGELAEELVLLSVNDTVAGVTRTVERLLADEAGVQP